MIVVDNDVISYFWLNAERTEAARRLRQQDSGWCAPYLWRSEFRSVLRQHMLHAELGLSDAVRYFESALADMHGREYDVIASDVLHLVSETRHSSYDCEYVALAQAFGVPLVTGDRHLANVFPDIAVVLEDFVSHT